jgi:putative selenate reductase
MMERLEQRARALDLGLGAKFTNTLIVENDQGFLPESEREVYLSGPPLHVLAMHLVRRFRRHFGDRVPVSFSAGIDSVNFPDAVALGLVPVTVCTDLLKKGGYGRMQAYHAELERRMELVGARTIDDYILRAHGLAEDALEQVEGPPENPPREACLEVLSEGGDLRRAAGDDLFARWVSAAKLLNTERYVEAVERDPRYGRQRNATAPRKIGRHLQLFDCITCDICVPVCPNDANFTYRIEADEIPVLKVQQRSDGWDWSQAGSLRFEERHQIGTFADFCNECGNCDVFCPEDGGPYVVKPRFFRRAEDWRASIELDGFQMTRQDGRDEVLGRFEGQEFELRAEASDIAFRGPGFRVRFDRQDPEGTLEGEAEGEVDLTYFFLMDTLRLAILEGDRINYINSLNA